MGTTSEKAAAMAERLIDAAVYNEQASGVYVSGARKELNEARAAIEAALSSSAGPAVKPVAYVYDPGAGSAMDKLLWARDRSYVEEDCKRRGGSLTPLYAHPAPATVESLPYQVLFNAIAAATDIASGGLAVSISVEKFRAALAPATEGRKG